MRDFLLTLRFLLKNTFSLNHFVHRINNDKQSRLIFILVAFALLTLIPTYVLMMTGLVNFYKIIDSIELGPDLVIQQGSVFIVIGTFIAFVLNFFFGMYHVIAHYYFSNDVKILLPKPIKVNSILLSKLSIIYIYYLIINGFLVLPFFVIYGVYGSLKIYQWFNLFLVFLFLPIIPLALSTLITVLMMKYTNLFKRKDLLRIVGMLLLIVFLFAIQIYFNRALLSLDGDPSQIEKIFTDNYFIVERIAKVYPILLLIINAIRFTFIKAFGNVLLLLVISIVVIFIVMKILHFIYLPSYFQEQIETHRQVKRKRKDLRIRSIPRAFARIDYLTMLRVPVYLLNCLGMVIILPVILFLLPLMMGGGEGFNTTDLIQKVYDEFQYPFWMMVILGITLLGSMNPIASTTFSREGKTHWIMRTLPISSRDHILARLYVPLVTHVVFSAITLGIILGILQTDYIMGVVAFILTLIAVIPVLFVGILIDLYRPLLTWENPQRAVKQNLNVLVSMGIGLAYIVLLGAGYFSFISAFDTLSPIVQFFIYISFYIVVNTILSILLYRLLIQKMEDRLVVMST